MKQLVYENYSKFVFASKTLQNINSSCDVMIASLEDLEKRLSNISTTTVKVDPNLIELNNRHVCIKKME